LDASGKIVGVVPTIPTRQSLNRKVKMKFKYKVMKLPDNYLMSAPGGAITYSDSSDFFKVEEKEAMSLKRLIKTFDPKKIFLVKYVNKKGNDQEKIITNGKHSDHNSSLFNSVG
jgi:hypothetical protein